MDRKIWLNGRVVGDAQAKVSIWDRGFLYGDGVYETVRVYQGKIFRGVQHWKRLDHSLAGVHIEIPWTHAFLTRACLKTIAANELEECLVRVTVTRGVGELGYDPSSCKNPALVILALPIRKDLPNRWRDGVKIALTHVRRNHPLTVNPALKTTNCLNGILAKIESLKAGAFEGIFLNVPGFVAEGTISNIFLVKNGRVRTPSLAQGILDGVTRAAVIETAKKLGIPLNETALRPQELVSADEVFLTSTTMEVMPVVQVDKKKIGKGKPGPVTRLLHKGFRALLKNELNLKLLPLPLGKWAR